MRTLLFVLLLAHPAYAQQTLSFAWDAQSLNTVGYLFAIGVQPGSSEDVINVGPTTVATSTFDAGTIRYVRVYAYNSVGETGLPSNELMIVTPIPPIFVCNDPLDVTVTQWPASKKTFSTLLYMSTCQIARVDPLGRGQQVTGARFTDVRGRIVTEMKP